MIRKNLVALFTGLSVLAQSICAGGYAWAGDPAASPAPAPAAATQQADAAAKAKAAKTDKTAWAILVGTGALVISAILGGLYGGVWLVPLRMNGQGVAPEALNDVRDTKSVSTPGVINPDESRGKPTALGAG